MEEAKRKRVVKLKVVEVPTPPEPLTNQIEKIFVHAGLASAEAVSRCFEVLDKCPTCGADKSNICTQYLKVTYACRHAMRHDKCNSCGAKWAYELAVKMIIPTSNKSVMIDKTNEYAKKLKLPEVEAGEDED